MATDGKATAGGLVVRPMRIEEIGVQIDYFHDASDEFLTLMGIDRQLMGSREEWSEYYGEDFARPLAERETYSLVWELDGRIVGFSLTDDIELGEQAFMHLHLIDEARRRSGLGTKFVRLSVEEYFRVLGLKRLFSQPNAFNAAPNRALQRAGFRYVLTTELQPGPINPRQPITRWVIERSRRSTKRG